MLSALVIASASIVLALEPEAINVDKLVRELGDGRVETREAASSALATLEGEAGRALELRLNDASLSPEQRIRIEGIVRERFMRSQRGALGVQFDQQAVITGGMRVSRVYPNFPAAAVLQAGDVIVQVEQTKIGANEPFYRSPLRPHIISREPGEKIKLVIERNGQKLDVEPMLGKFTDFPVDRMMGQTQPSPEDLRAAWLTRRARLGIASAKAIDAGLGPMDWMPRGRTMVEADVIRRGDIQGVPVAIGGRPASVVNPDDVHQFEKQTFVKGEGVMVLRGDGRFFQGGGGVMDARTTAAERELQNQYVKLWMIYQDASTKANNVTLKAEEREKAQLEMNKIERQMAEVQNRIGQLRDAPRK